MFISEGFTLLGPDASGRSARRRFSLERLLVHHKFPTFDDLKGGGGLTKSAPVTDLPAPPDSSGGRWRIISPEVSTFDNRIIVARLDRDIFQTFFASNKPTDVVERAKAKLKGVASWITDYPRIQRPDQIEETLSQILKAELRALHQAEGCTLLSLGETSAPFVNNVLCRALVGLHREDIHPAICDIDTDAIESLQTKKLDQLSPLYETEEAAVKALQGGNG